MDRNYLIDYILKNSCIFAKAQLEQMSLQDLVIIKVEIELNLANQTKG
jgi:hypothetical protein